MLKYIVKRLLQAIPLLFIISVICFSLIQLAPFDAVDAIVTPAMSPEAVAITKAKYGLDKPAYVQYFYWLGNILHGDFGYSIITHESIANDLSARIPASMALVLPAYLISVALALVLGLYSGYNRGKWVDKFAEGLSSIGLAIPIFWFALMLIYIFSYRLGLFPILGMYSVGHEGEYLNFLWHLILPCTVLTIGFLPEQLRYIRSATVRELSQDYVMVQSAYGASTKEILFKHVLKNVSLPVVTLLGMSLPMMVTGAFVTETIFSWPGVGPYFVKAIQGYDYPVVMAILLLSSTLVIIGNLISDILYGIIDPRIRHGRTSV